ncbi:hypothetical protein [Cellulomonas sp. P5_C5]
MNSVPSTTPEQDVDVDEEESSWTDFLLPIAFFALAAIPFTPFWEQIADPESTRRRYGGISRFLDSVGPVPVALAFAGIGVALLVVAIVQRSRKSGSAAAEGSED